MHGAAKETRQRLMDIAVENLSAYVHGKPIHVVNLSQKDKENEFIVFGTAQKSYGEKVLLKQANFYLNEGEKVGIIGINGTGKTTLLRILAGTEVPDEGSRTVANHVVLRFLEQNPQMPADMSVLEYVLQGEKEEDRWILEPDAKTLLMTFELNDFNQPCGQLSGGQKKRAALAKTLLRPADILILDEPTNHLDTKMADWLEDYLRRYRGAMNYGNT